MQPRPPVRRTLYLGQADQGPDVQGAAPTSATTEDLLPSIFHGRERETARLWEWKNQPQGRGEIPLLLITLAGTCHSHILNSLSTTSPNMGKPSIMGQACSHVSRARQMGTSTQMGKCRLNEASRVPGDAQWKSAWLGRAGEQGSKGAPVPQNPPLHHSPPTLF